MRRIVARYLLVILLLLIALPANAGEEGGAATPDRVVAALEATFGVSPGQRRNHIKGTCALGEFVGMRNPYSRSGLFDGRAVPVVARFSLAGGNPGAPDTARSPRGMALEFRLPKGALQHMTMLNTPIFGAAKPQTFLDAIVAMRPDPVTGKADPEKISAFKESHPDSRAQGEYLATHNPPPSYANSAYYGIHTFHFVNEKGQVTMVRWRFEPQDGEKQLTDEQMKSMPHDFLEQALLDRVVKGPLRWDMYITIGLPGDSEDDPAASWPAGRVEVKVGTLTLASAMSQHGAECAGINYDPLVMADGIEPSDDPILNFRSAAYAISFSRRMKGQ